MDWESSKIFMRRARYRINGHDSLLHQIFSPPFALTAWHYTTAGEIHRILLTTKRTGLKIFQVGNEIYRCITVTLLDHVSDFTHSLSQSFACARSTVAKHSTNPHFGETTTWQQPPCCFGSAAHVTRAKARSDPLRLLLIITSRPASSSIRSSS